MIIPRPHRFFAVPVGLANREKCELITLIEVIYIKLKSF